MAEMKPSDNKGQESPLEKAVQTGNPVLSLIDAGKPLYHPTDAEPQMNWEGKTGRINVGGGAGIPGGYSVKLNPEGENSVEFYRD